jgi:hypothetical protein
MPKKLLEQTKASGGSRVTTLIILLCKILNPYLKLLLLYASPNTII